jgi:hypothetical protein
VNCREQPRPGGTSAPNQLSLAFPPPIHTHAARCPSGLPGGGFCRRRAGCPNLRRSGPTARRGGHRRAGPHRPHPPPKSHVEQLDLGDHGRLSEALEYADDCDQGTIDRAAWLHLRAKVQRRSEDARRSLTRDPSDVLGGLDLSGGLRPKWADLSLDRKQAIITTVIERVSLGPGHGRPGPLRSGARRRRVEGLKRPHPPILVRHVCWRLRRRDASDGCRRRLAASTRGRSTDLVPGEGPSTIREFRDADQGLT